MPNHLYVLIGFRCAAQSINTIISNGKRFTAYELVKRLQRGGHEAILKQLAAAVSASDYKKGKRPGI
jgi:hypothetical protein